MKKSNPSFFAQIFFSIMGLILVLGVLFSLNSIIHLRRMYFASVRRELVSTSEAFSRIYKESEISLFSMDSLLKKQYHDGGIRYTLIQPDGQVIADSHNDIDAMDNHKTRPEVRHAFASGWGYEVRFSATEGVHHKYVARRNNDGSITRTSRPLDQLLDSLWSYTASLILLFLFLGGVGLSLSFFLSRWISRPIEILKNRAEKLGEGDVFTPLADRRVSREIMDLSRILDRASQTLKKRFTSVRTHKDRLRTILSEMIEGVVAVNAERELFLINSRARQMLDISSDTSQGREYYKIIRHIEIQQIIDTLLAGDSVQTMIHEEVTLGRGENERIYRINGKALLDPGDVFLVIHDITALKRLENMRRDFAGNVSHELRTPLTSIKGFVETLKDGAITDPVQSVRFLTIIDEEVRRLNTLIEDILTLSRVEQQEEALSDNSADTERVNLCDFLNELYGLYTDRAKKYSVDLRKDIHLAPDPLVDIRPGLFSLAVKNLLDNAVKYSGENAVVTLRARERQDEYIVSVQDTGPGIDPVHHDRLFERFYRVDKSRSRHMGGTGLGLSIVKHIVSLHGGKIILESEPGQGSIFTITIHKPL
ncbi:HAMP domain-containing sensor histidine kinase [Chitinivibrio alkaliphilus]|uniref:histidine kinase n=1 Tax=Chitinivibrio alkaliphilus ACht1 TaxID=1313304 RepID=U7D9C7_9BACT|nr:ATP-binding protein [Chitinivibrio alkaliphilus]ERP31010.1 phosphate regulon sensor kinase PhoR [Chitinivibrio alkaliphilus ACht1]